MECELKGAKVAICGSFGGIGQAICKELLDCGISHLSALDLKIDVDTLNKWKQSHPNQTIVSEVLDVTKKDAVDSVLRKAKDQMGGLDIFINCSGILNEKNPDLTIQVNLLGTIYTTLASIELMGKQNGGKGGTVVNVASVLGLEPCLPYPVYTATKHGVVGLSRSFSSEFHLNKTGVRLITICPGLTETNIIRDVEKLRVFDYTKPIVDIILTAKTQEADICGKNIVKAIENGKHGSIWISDLGKLYEATMPKHWDMTF